MPIFPMGFILCLRKLPEFEFGQLRNHRVSETETVKRKAARFNPNGQRAGPSSPAAWCPRCLSPPQGGWGAGAPPRPLEERTVVHLHWEKPRTEW